MTQEKDLKATRPKTPPQTESTPHAITPQAGQAEGAQLNPGDLYALQGLVGNTAVGQLGQIQRTPQSAGNLESASQAAFGSILGRGQTITPKPQTIQRAPENEQNVPMDEDEMAEQGKPNIPQLDLSGVGTSTQGGLGGAVPKLDLAGVGTSTQGGLGGAPKVPKLNMGKVRPNFVPELDTTNVGASTQGGLGGLPVRPEVPKLNMNKVRPNFVPELDMSNMGTSAQGGMGGLPVRPDEEQPAETDNVRSEVGKARQQFTLEDAQKRAEGQRLKQISDDQFLVTHIEKLVQSNISDEAKIAYIQQYEAAKNRLSRMSTNELRRHRIRQGKAQLSSAKDVAIEAGGMIADKGATLADTAGSALGVTAQALEGIRTISTLAASLSQSAGIASSLLSGDYSGHKLDLFMDMGQNVLAIGETLLDIAQMCLSQASPAMDYVPILGTVAAAVSIMQSAYHLIKQGNRLLHEIKNSRQAKRERNKALQLSLGSFANKNVQLAATSTMEIVASTLQGIGATLAVIPDPNGAVESVGLALTLAGTAVNTMNSSANLIIANVRAKKSQSSEKHLAQGRESGAKEVLKYNFKYAAQIVIQQAREGNEIALDQLSHYGVHQKNLATSNDAELREKMLGKIDESEDPATTLQTFISMAKALGSGTSSLVKKPYRAYQIAKGQKAMGLKGGSTALNALKGTFSLDDTLTQKEAMLYTVSQSHNALSDEQKAKYGKKFETKEQKMGRKFGSSLGDEGDPGISRPMGDARMMQLLNERAAAEQVPQNGETEEAVN